MERKQSYGSSAFRNGRWRVLVATALSVMLALVFGGTAFAQNVSVTGTVTSAGGSPLPGVTVRVQGSDVRTLTDASGNLALPDTAGHDGALGGVLTWTEMPRKFGVFGAPIYWAEWDVTPVSGAGK